MGQSGNYVLIVLRFQNTRGSWSYRRFNALFAALFATEFSASKYKNSSQKIIEAAHKIWSVVHTYIEHVETCFTAVLWIFTGAAIFGKSPISSKLGPRSSKRSFISMSWGCSSACAGRSVSMTSIRFAISFITSPFIDEPLGSQRAPWFLIKAVRIEWSSQWDNQWDNQWVFQWNVQFNIYICFSVIVV